MIFKMQYKITLEGPIQVEAETEEKAKKILKEAKPLLLWPEGTGIIQWPEEED